jgi:transcriptional regulator with XRE-family HTH domain
MDIVEKINYLIKEKNMSKKEFADALQSLEPKLKSTGNTPNIQTIYGYLSGKRELKVELIPYIAEVLGVQEQELFCFDIEYASAYNIRYSDEAREIIELLSYAPKHVREEIRVLLTELKQHSIHQLKSIKSKLI